MKVKFGIMGLGGIAHRFAKVLKTVEGVELAAVASSDEGRSRQFATEYGVEKYFWDYSELAADPSIDVVYIAQTHDRHYELIKLCIGYKKGVICEKPMVLTEQQALEVTGLAKENGVLLMEAMWSRFIPTFQKAKEWVTGGRIGQVRLVQASFCFNFPFDPAHRLYNPDKAGGSLYDAGIYPIAFTTGILDENPLEVKATGTLCETGVDDYLAMAMKFESGALATLSCGLRAETNRDAYVYGDNGYVVVYDFLGSRKTELYDKNHQLCEMFESEFEDGFCYEIQHFAELFRNGKTESGIMPHRDNIAVARVFEDVLRQIHGE
ncbi:Gfo/Idh/MocA family protein [Anaerobium acetethylicum]|uniref:Predicted dehydrogenase n=1 Tax=Anaerobium acetethylicum TaxID=1619234 RepID=A0A1D3TWP9_9FIRM|nr:Gfo/Idh/MocA family oxidoreductase [Anaerobium acetethylicum]SCP98671.1 Predicted dehydrogenase [Anaerobium acetethylicum]